MTCTSPHELRLSGERLVLRDFRPSDRDAFVAYHRDPRYLEYYGPEVAAPDHARELLDRFLASARESPRVDWNWAIASSDGERLLGCCSLRTSREEPGDAELGLELAPDAWGQGLATEAARLALGFAFGRMAFQRIVCDTVTENARVAALLRRLGFRPLSQHPGSGWMRAKGWSRTLWVLPAANGSEGEER